MLKRHLKLQSGRNFDVINKVAFIGDYLPRKCGIATFTHDLRNAFHEEHPEIKAVVVAVNDTKDGYAYSQDVVFEMDEQDEVSYMRAADYINNSGVDLVCLQHEFGIYGGPCGAMILSLLKALRVPIVTTLHTILTDPSPDQRTVLNSILSISTRVVTMAQKGKDILESIYSAPMDKLRLIPHGIPEMEFADTETYKKQLGLSGRKVILTFGLLSPNKGIEFAVRGMAAVAKKCPDALYVYLGQTHPHLIREYGEAYRNELLFIAKDLGIQDNVTFINRFVDLPLLKQYIAACDVYLTPYLHEAQITSGTLSYAFGMGTAVVSTPYWHAAELLADDRGILVPFRNAEEIGAKCSDLLLDDEKRMSMKRNAFDYGRTMTWGNTAEAYNTVFDEAREAHANAPIITMPAPVETTLPSVKLDHVIRMTDDTGMLQFANIAVPNRLEGYCVDDNSRALILLGMLKHGGFTWSPELEKLASTYAAFVDYSYDRQNDRFRNFMSYGRQWIEQDESSQDSRARALWALGNCVKVGLNDVWATDLFRLASRNAGDGSFTYSRSIAFLILGFDGYLERFPADGERIPVLKSLAYKLKAMYDANAVAKDNWLWFEDFLSYDNGMLPYAMIAAGRRLQDEEIAKVGYESLSWLMTSQLIGDNFSPIGNEKWWRKGEVKSLMDQQPLEAASSILACCEAVLSGDTRDDWLDHASRAFNWFMGGNLLGRSLYDANTGGCGDGLGKGGINKNQGAESLIAFQLSLVALKRAKAVGMMTPVTPQTFSTIKPME